ncbi:MAG: hypothetical protein CMJ27_04780 [Phycisphaerae bacterium]|nr:hypothetical protein [Phycisphaerae bacterium]OUX02300.1 MAG: hypothetical protein CBD91_02890 [Phycisphaeraceae bacterium TMED231]
MGSGMPFSVSTHERSDDALEASLFDAVANGSIPGLDVRDLLHRLRSATRRPRRQAVRAEIEVALRFIAAGDRVRAEVLDPGGRSIDLEVHAGDDVFAVHVKRLSGSSGPKRPLDDSFAALESVPRPYLVGIDWTPTIPPDTVQLADAREFLMGARMGDRHVLRDAAGRRVGMMEMSAPRQATEPEKTPGVKVIAVGDANRAAAMVARTERLLRRAYRQFAPGRENVIVLIGGGPAAGEIVERAVLGGFVERWDRFPRIGQRIAHGRDDRGIWTGRHYERSRIVAWHPFEPTPGRVWVRPDRRPPVASVIAAVERAIEPAG